MFSLDPLQLSTTVAITPTFSLSLSVHPHPPLQSSPSIRRSNKPPPNQPQPSAFSVNKFLAHVQPFFPLLIPLVPALRLQESISYEPARLSSRLLCRSIMVLTAVFWGSSCHTLLLILFGIGRPQPGFNQAKNPVLTRRHPDKFQCFHRISNSRSRRCSWTSHPCDERAVDDADSRNANKSKNMGDDWCIGAAWTMGRVRLEILSDTWKKTKEVWGMALFVAGTEGSRKLRCW